MEMWASVVSKKNPTTTESYRRIYHRVSLSFTEDEENGILDSVFLRVLCGEISKAELIVCSLKIKRKP